jgi:hypothetical protein
MHAKVIEFLSSIPGALNEGTIAKFEKNDDLFDLVIVHKLANGQTANEVVTLTEEEAADLDVQVGARIVNLLGGLQYFTPDSEQKAA